MARRRLARLLPRRGGRRRQCRNADRGRGAEDFEKPRESPATSSGSTAACIPKAFIAYGRVVTKCPCTCFCLYIAVAVVLGVALWHPLIIDMDMSSFSRSDGEALRRLDAYTAAAKVGVVRDDSNNRRLASNTYVVERLLILVYVPKNGDVLNDRVLQDVRDFEATLRNMPKWRHICGDLVHSSHTYFCEPGETFIAYTWPTEAPINGTWSNLTTQLQLDARGRIPLDPRIGVSYLQGPLSPIYYDLGQFFPTDYQPGDLGEQQGIATPPAALRTVYRFRFSQAGAAQGGKAQYDNFLFGELYPYIRDHAKDSSNMRVYYRGTGVLEHEIMDILFKDIARVVGSIIIVSLYLWLHTRSKLISICTILIIFLSIFVAYSMVPTTKTHVAAFFSLFLMLGAGCDLVFVFHDFWRQSAVHTVMPVRVAWMLTNAGRSCFAVSITTSVSFFSNLSSSMRTFREFGLFMGAAVMMAWVLFTCTLPPLYVHLELRRQRRLAKQAQASGGTIIAEPQTAPTPTVKDPKWLVKLITWTGACPISVLVVAMLAAIAFVVGISQTLTLETTPPDLFPKDHNQVAVLAWTEKRFQKEYVLAQEPPELANACGVDEWDRVLGAGGSCLYYQCEKSEAPASSGASCWAAPSGRAQIPGSCPSIISRARLAANSTSPPALDWRKLWVSLLANYTNMSAAAASSAYMQKINSYLALQDWESGELEMRDFYELGTVSIAANNTDPTSKGLDDCRVDIFCFYGTGRCDVPGWQQLQVDPQDWPSPLAGARILQAAPSNTVVNGYTIGVRVIFGVLPPARSPSIGDRAESFRFDPFYDAANPWAQRATRSMCDLPPELPVDDTGGIGIRCWIRDFQKDLTEAGGRFPSRDFTTEVIRWWSTTTNYKHKDITIVDGRVAAVKLEFQGIAPSKRPERIMEYRQLWDDYVDKRNAAAGASANRAYHLSQAWVTAETQLEVVSSVVATVLITAASAFLALLLFTQNIVLAVYILFLVLWIIAAILFFITVIMGWMLGPVEIVCLIIYLGYSVTYSQIIAQEYTKITRYDPKVLEIARRQAMLSAGDQQEGALASMHAVLPVPHAAGVLPSVSEKPEVDFRGEGERTEKAPCLDCETGDPGMLAVLPSAAQYCAEEEAVILLEGTALRRARVQVTLTRISRATVGSAMSTTGSCCFLFTCTISVFVKLATVLVAVTVTSLVVGLLVLPSVLRVIGPPDTEMFPWGRWLRWARTLRRRRREVAQ